MTPSSPTPVGEHSPLGQSLFIAENDQTVTSVGRLFQSCKKVARNVLEYCLSGPVVLPPSQTESRRSLIQTCRLWRNIILNTPTYWNQIFFAPGQFSSLEKLVGLAQQAIQRSGIEPLDLDFVGRPIEWSVIREAGATLRVEELIYGRARLSIMRTIVLPNKNRIRSLRFLVCTNEDFDELKNIQGHQFPIFEALDVGIPPSLVGEFVESFNSQTGQIRKGLDTLAKMQQLSLHLFESAPFHPYAMSRLQWQQLTKINFGTFYITPDVFLGILQQTSASLAQANFSVLFSPVALSLPLGSVYIPSLWDLQLTIRNAARDTLFFNALHLPGIKCLQIHVIDVCATTCDVILFMNMIYNMHLLEILKIGHKSLRSHPPCIAPTTSTPAASDTMEKLLEKLNNLQNLGLPRGMRVRASVIDRLAQGKLLPSLTHLELTAAEDWEEIMDMVHGRKKVAEYCKLAPGVSSRIHPRALSFIHIFLPASVYHAQKSVVDDAESLDGLVKVDKLPEGSPIYFAEGST